jgi:hypothetical protein
MVHYQMINKLPSFNSSIIQMNYHPIIMDVKLIYHLQIVHDDDDDDDESQPFFFLDVKFWTFLVAISLIKK